MPTIPDLSNSAHITKSLVKPLRYDSAQDVQMRLRDTICRYDGEPVFIQGITAIPGDPSGLYVNARYILSGIPVTFHSSDVLLDVSSVPLGWFDGPEYQKPLYMCRTTKTSQRQGVHPQSMQLWDPCRRDFINGLGWSNWQDLIPLGRAVKGDVFKITKVISRPYGGALGRDWALVNPRGDGKLYTVYHRSIEVGTFFAKANEFYFRAGRLTKTRRASLQEIFSHPNNAGVPYAVTEQS